MQTATINFTQSTTVNKSITTSIALRNDAIQKIAIFTAILSCVVAAINL